jgi:hypothetical protein
MRAFGRAAGGGGQLLSSFILFNIGSAWLLYSIGSPPSWPLYTGSGSGSGSRSE